MGPGPAAPAAPMRSQPAGLPAERVGTVVVIIGATAAGKGTKPR
jgi:hypothetical protein